MLPLSLFIFVLSVYIRGISSSSFAGDSGDIILASWFGGVAHPPGYPLNTMIGWLFTHAPYSASVAFKANLMAAFLQAGTAVLVYLISKLLTGRIFVSIVVALIFAFNPLIWLYAHIIEVFQLNLLLVSISVYFLFCWGERKKTKTETAINKNLIVSMLFLGLAVFHHHTSILLFPAFFYFIYKSSKNLIRFKSFFILLAVFLVGFLPYIFIPFAAFRATPANWDDPSNISNFLRLITRADYGMFQASNFIIGDTLSRRVIQLGNYFLFLKADFGFFGLGCIVLGLANSFLNRKRYFIFLTLSIIFSGPFFFFYGSFPILNDFYVGLWERFLLLSYLFVIILIGLGLHLVAGKMESILDGINLTPLGRSGKILLANGIFFVIPLVMFSVNNIKTNLSNFQLGDWLAYDTLHSADEGSIVFLVGDTSVFNTQYVYYTDKKMQNYNIIRMGSLNRKEYRKQIYADYKDVTFPDDFLTRENEESLYFVNSIIEHNLGRLPIYSADYIPSVDNFYWMQAGLLKKLVRKDDLNKDLLVRVNQRAFENFKFRDYQSPSYTHYLETHIREVYYNSFISAARELFANQEVDLAVLYLNRASEIIPERKEAYISLASIYFQLNECQRSSDLLLQAMSLDKKDFNITSSLADLYKTCLGDEEKSNYFMDLSNKIRKKYHEKSL